MYPIFTHRAHWSHKSGNVQNVPTVFTTRHIVITCCLYSQCVHHVLTRYFGPCPQCMLPRSSTTTSTLVIPPNESPCPPPPSWKPSKAKHPRMSNELTSHS